MFMGTGSDVGKSVLVAGICRALVNRGYNVRPFKPQNMSNNAAVTEDGGEIGRAQALQALACRVSAHTDMNPVLLKPQTDKKSQVIVHGKIRGQSDASYYRTHKKELLGAVIESFERLEQQADFVVVEGAGSASEINLRAGDIANMGFARAKDVPVVLIGDIDRGGVIASLIGTKHVIDKDDEKQIKGFIINKFRGDISLFTDGYKLIEDLSNWQGLGVVPWLKTVRLLPAEDAVILDNHESKKDAKVKIAVLMLSRIANFDDFDPLAQDENVKLSMIAPGQIVPVDTDLIIIPGTKATIADLEFLREQGWDIDIYSHIRRGGRVLGICGGYQMLGKIIRDKDKIEGEKQEIEGLGLLDMETDLLPHKILRKSKGKAFGNVPFEGYEIHIGRTYGDEEPLLEFEYGKKDGAISKDNKVFGCYVHGFFDTKEQREYWLNIEASNERNHQKYVDEVLDKLAQEIEQHIDIEAIIKIANKK